MIGGGEGGERATSRGNNTRVQTLEKIANSSVWRLKELAKEAENISWGQIVMRPTGLKTVSSI